MKTIKEIALAAIDKIRPSNAEAIALYADSKNPEIMSGREVLIHQRQCSADIIEDAIREAIEQESRNNLRFSSVCREQRTALEAVWDCWTKGGDLNLATTLVRALVCPPPQKLGPPDVPGSGPNPHPSIRNMVG